jgi:Tfp pilus assembly protein PilF
MTSNALLQQFDALLENPRLVPYDRAMVLTRMGAVAQAMNKDAKQAREYYRQALEIMPSPGVRLLYAQLLQEQGDLVAARQELAKAEAGRFDEDWQPSTARRLHELLDATHPGIDAVKAVTPLQP